ncbi:MAG: hypothetical protein ACRC80_29010 [Waterburya sp.]
MKRLLHLFSSEVLSQNILNQNLLKIYIPACLFIVLVWLTTKITDISAYELVADSNEIGEIPPYAGIVSNIGILLLSSTVSICLFSGYLIKNNSKRERETYSLAKQVTRNQGNHKWQRFLLVSGYFILFFLLDDLFQLHENFSKLLFGAETNLSLVNRKLENLIEISIFGFYGLLFSSYIFYFRKLIYNSNFFLLLICLACGAMSSVVDYLPETMVGHHILEEGFKFLGIVSLMSYYVMVCYQQLKLNKY